MAKEAKHEAKHAAPAGTQTIKIKNVAFTAPAPYAEGHTITAAEANTLNQTLAENLRNNFSKRATKALEADSSAESIAKLQDEFAAYADAYEFHGKRVSSRAPVDPVAKEAHKIAKSMILEALKKANKDPKSLAEGQLDKLVTELAGRQSVQDAAKRRVEELQSVASTTLEGLL